MFIFIPCLILNKTVRPEGGVQNEQIRNYVHYETYTR